MSPVNALRGSQIAMRHELHKDVRAHRGSAKRGKVYIHIGLNPLDSIGNVIICEYLCFFWILPLVFLVIIISISIYIYNGVSQSIYQWLCINNVDNALAGGLENVKISWEFSLTKVGKCSVSFEKGLL